MTVLFIPYMTVLLAADMTVLFFSYMTVLFGLQGGEQGWTGEELRRQQTDTNMLSDCLVCGYNCLICGYDCHISGYDCLIFARRKHADAFGIAGR